MANIERAKESDQVKRARRKLEAQLEEEHERITPGALRAATQKILNRMERTSSQRKSLKEKNVNLFDQNRHSASVTSHFVSHLRTQITEEFREAERTGLSSLIGRISPGEATPPPSNVEQN